MKTCPTDEQMRRAYRHAKFATKSALYGIPRLNIAKLNRADNAEKQLRKTANKWIPGALDRLERIRQLHQPLNQGAAPELCEICEQCGYLYPCPTLQIVDGRP